MSDDDAAVAPTERDLTCGDGYRYPAAAGIVATLVPGTTANTLHYRITNGTSRALEVNPLFGVAQIAYDAHGRVDHFEYDASSVLALPITIGAGQTETLRPEIGFSPLDCHGHPLASGHRTVYLLVDLGTGIPHRWSVAGSTQVQIDGTHATIRNN